MLGVCADANIFILAEPIRSNWPPSLMQATWIHFIMRVPRAIDVTWQYHFHPLTQATKQLHKIHSSLMQPNKHFAFHMHCIHSASSHPRYFFHYKTKTRNTLLAKPVTRHAQESLVVLMSSRVPPRVRAVAAHLIIYTFF